MICMKIEANVRNLSKTGSASTQNFKTVGAEAPTSPILTGALHILWGIK